MGSVRFRENKNYSIIDEISKGRPTIIGILKESN